jgi:hypothetical protein
MSSTKGVDDLLSPNWDKVMPEEGFIVEEGDLVSGISGKLRGSSQGPKQKGG